MGQKGGKWGGRAKRAGCRLKRLRRTQKGQRQQGMGPGGRNQGPENVIIIILILILILLQRVVGASEAHLRHSAA